MKLPPIRRRGDSYYIVRRVPKRYAKVEDRKVVWMSLNTDSESLAIEKAGRAWRDMEEAWEAKLAGDTHDAERRFAAAKDLAKARGFRWISAHDVSKLPVEELLERVEAVTKANGQPDRASAEAILGGAKDPPVTVRRALELYWTLARDKTLNMSPDQLRRWRNPRIKAISNFISTVGDKELRAITVDDFLNFREWWVDRLAAEGMAPNSANKDFIHLGSVLRTVNKLKRLGVSIPFEGLASVRDGNKRDRVRPPFSEGWIRNHLLAPGALDGLNSEARAVLHAMINTGCRPSELVGLLPHHIYLDHHVPHITIRAEGKRIKTDDSKRDIPLVGISLKAFVAFPQGFPTYRFKDLISDTVNNFLRANGLLETPAHSLYGLRHAFEDRMLAAGIDERVRRDLMGHSLRRERYGKGASLEQLRDLLGRIAI